MAGHMVLQPGSKESSVLILSPLSLIQDWKFPSPIQCNVLPTFRVSVHLHECRLEMFMSQTFMSKVVLDPVKLIVDIVFPSMHLIKERVLINT